MGVITLVTVLVLALGGIAAMLLGMYRRRQLIYSDEDLADILPLLLPVDMERLQNYFDPGLEWSLRNSSTSREFRSLQRSRRRIAITHVRRIFHNAGLLQTLGYAALASGEAEQGQLGKAIIDAAVPIKAQATLVVLFLTTQRVLSPSSSLSAGAEIFEPLILDYAGLRSFALDLVHRRNPNFDAEIERLL